MGNDRRQLLLVAERKGGVDNDELRDWYLALSDSDKQVFLSLVSNQLTRCFGLDLAEVEQINAFKGLNELQH